MTASINRFQKQDTKGIISAGILLVSLCIAFFFTMDVYYSYASAKDELTKTLTEKQTKTATLDSLNALKTQASDPMAKAELERYAGEYREDSYLAVLLANVPNIAVSSVALDKGEKLPSGLSKANFTIAFQASNEAALVSFLDSLTSATAKKRFQIKTLSFPFETSKMSLGAIPVSVQLGSYYLAR